MPESDAGDADQTERGLRERTETGTDHGIRPVNYSNEIGRLLPVNVRSSSGRSPTGNPKRELLR